MHPVGVLLYITFLSVRKNEQKFGIAEDDWKLPTTQKVVANAIVSTGLYTDQNGFCKLYMDNCYSSHKLFVMLKTKYKILAYGTVLTNRIGWDQQLMNLSKSATRGNLKMSRILSMDFFLYIGRITKWCHSHLLYRWMVMVQLCNGLEARSSCLLVPRHFKCIISIWDM